MMVDTATMIKRGQDSGTGEEVVLAPVCSAHHVEAPEGLTSIRQMDFTLELRRSASWATVMLGMSCSSYTDKLVKHRACKASHKAKVETDVNLTIEALLK
jgi:hypothetical protein